MAVVDAEDVQAGMEQGAALDEHAPYATWPRSVQRSWLITNAPRIAREHRYLHLTGIALCLACIALDALAGVFILGAALRLGVVIPLYGIGIWLLNSEHSWLRLVGVIGPVVGFAGMASFIGIFTSNEFSDRYSMAAAMLIAVSIVQYPLRVGPSFWLSITGFLALALPFAAARYTDPGTVDFLAFSLVCCLAPLLLKRRSEQLRDQNFILSLKSRQAQKDLLASNRELENLSQIDPLTGLLNRRGFERKFSAAFEAALASGEPIAVVLLDIDHFKQFNDTYGHQLGDECLAKIGSLLKTEIDQHKGVAGRYGGEEFISTFTGSESANAASISERLRKKIADLEILDASGNRIEVTASFGTRIARATTLGQYELVRDADKALYVAKKDGRNRVALYQGEGKSLMVDEEAGSPARTRYEARASGSGSGRGKRAP